MVAHTTVEGFSISHAAILDGTTGAQAEFFGDAEAGDIYGVRSGSLEADTDSYDNTGDDAVLSSWFWFNFATLSVQSGYVPFKTVAALQGAVVTSSGAAGSEIYSMPIWNERSFNQPTKPVLVRCPSKDKNGLARTLDFVLYKVQFQPINFDGPNYKDGLLLNYTGRALMSDVDEKGQPLMAPKDPTKPVDATNPLVPDKAPGRLISAPF